MFTEAKMGVTEYRAFYAETYNTSVNVALRGRNSLTYRLSGTTRIKTETYDATSVPGTVTLVPDGTDYFTETTRGKMIVLHFSGAPRLPDKPEIFAPASAEAVRGMFDHLVTLYNRRQNDFEYGFLSSLCALFAKLGSESRSVSDAADYARISAAVEHLRAEIGNPELDVGQLSEICGISEPYFRRLFRRVFGCSPVSYIISQRIDKAKALLGTGLYTVAETAETCGFSDASYFSNVFMRETGQRPSEYRRM